MRSIAELQKIVDSATVAKSVFELRPDYLALLIAVDNITASPSDSSSDQLLQTAELAAKARISSTVVTEVAEIKAWRDTYKSFGAKPKKYQSSIEALTRRAIAGGLPRVNKLTDIYNAVSVSHNICLGGEDLDAYVGYPRLIRATGDEKFTTKAGDEKPEKGEVVWCDEEGVTCRNWNWRQCVRTQLKDETTSALFILDALAPVTREKLEVAGEELVQRLREGSQGLVVAKRVIDAQDGVGA
ncbi:B3/B4 tRNA-binding domain-containing protein [Aureobasidium sp. EXF-12298]|nr:B3/B4 tRNA-binding domain-containing protein [Aureobasidium sp. EXF-12298]KAI4753160.1 B3/B4 tRNA-binding domain-containing protein [Aureobasidium sp. EXF-12344]KAI4777560.1 B3/B4 tRNA-binding domain-containing protein [Aureobasidium sp. EXF-3400]